MKKMLFSSIALLLMVNLFAQRPEESPQKQPPIIEQRWKRDSVKLQTHLSLSAMQTGKLKNAFVSFYKEFDALAAKDAMPNTYLKMMTFNLHSLVKAMKEN